MEANEKMLRLLKQTNDRITQLEQRLDLTEKQVVEHSRYLNKIYDHLKDINRQMKQQGMLALSAWEILRRQAWFWGIVGLVGIAITIASIAIAMR